MTLMLLMPWFPILLTVGLGGRLLGRTRGYALGLLGALFWIALVQSSTGSSVWAQAWNVATLLVGCGALIAMGGWAGESALETTSGAGAVRPATTTDRPKSESVEVALERITESFDEFNGWLAEHRDDPDPWPKFDGLIRAMLYRGCRATHVRPYRVQTVDQPLVPLTEADVSTGLKNALPTSGAVSDVIQTGQSYVATGVAPGSRPMDSVAWCFAIQRGTQRTGVVVVEQLGIRAEANRALLTVMERLVAHCWSALQEACQARAAVLGDPVSGLFTREAFVRFAEESLVDSYRQDEPVAVVVVALEGLREIHDAGRWEVADELIRSVGCVLRQKTRTDDRLARFDGSRFLLLMRRVDTQLANLITAQIVARLHALCADTARWGASVRVRCGLAGSGNEQPNLRTLISRALAQWQRARMEKTTIAGEPGADVEGGKPNPNWGGSEPQKGKSAQLEPVIEGRG